jgi:hypothetical protein
LFTKRFAGFAFTAEEEVEGRLALAIGVLVLSIGVLKPLVVVHKVPVEGSGG